MTVARSRPPRPPAAVLVWSGGYIGTNVKCYSANGRFCPKGYYCTAMSTSFWAVSHAFLSPAATPRTRAVGYALLSAHTHRVLIGASNVIMPDSLARPQVPLAKRTNLRSSGLRTSSAAVPTMTLMTVRC